jgi:hypothetical protein
MGGGRWHKLRKKTIAQAAANAENLRRVNLDRSRERKEIEKEEIEEESLEAETNNNDTTDQLQDATDNNSKVDPSETNDAIAEAQVAAPGGYKSDSNNLGRYYVPYTQIMADSTLLQAQIAAAEASRTPIGDPVDSLSIRDSRKRKTPEKENWRQVKYKENK